MTKPGWEAETGALAAVAAGAAATALGTDGWAALRRFFAGWFRLLHRRTHTPATPNPGASSSDDRPVTPRQIIRADRGGTAIGVQDGNVHYYAAAALPTGADAEGEDGS